MSRAKLKPVRDFSRGGVRVEDGPLADLVRAVGTMPALAEMIGISASTLRRINQGERAPKKGEALLLATIAKQYRVAAPTFAVRTWTATYFIAEKGPGGINGDTFLCQACNERLGTYDPGDDDVEVWELGGIGWTRTIRCRVCNVVVASKDPQAGKDART